MTYQYPAAVFETEDGWTAVFPDLDGLTVSAATMEGLMKACREAVSYTHLTLPTNSLV